MFRLEDTKYLHLKEAYASYGMLDIRVVDYRISNCIFAGLGPILIEVCL